MTIVASNSLTVSNVNDGTITHTAYAYSSDGTDRFTTVYPNLNLLNFNSGVTLGKYYGWRLDVTAWSGNRAYFKKVKVTPNSQYTISANWSNTEWLNVYAFTNESDTTAVARYGSAGGIGVGSWDSSNLAGGYTVANNMTFTVPANVNYIGVSYASLSTNTLTLQALLNGKPKLEIGSTATLWMPSASEVKTSDYPSYIGTCTTTQATAPTAAGSYVWAKFVGANGAKGDPTGITRSTTEPATRYTGMLWQYTGTVNLVATGITALPSSLYVWTGSAWQLYLVKSTNLQVDNGFITNAMIGDATIESAKIKSIEAKKILADSLDAISGNLGTMTAGIIKIIADIVINAADKTKKFGMLFTKKGLLSSGPSYKADSTVSDTKMAVASLTQGELRFVNTNYNDDLEQVQDRGTSSSNTGFLRFTSNENGDLLEITSSGRILLNGLTTQTSPWVDASAFAKYRVAFGTVTVSVGLVNGSGTSAIYLGNIPAGLRPLRSTMLFAGAWSTDNSRDRHLQINAEDGNMSLISPYPGQDYRFEVSWAIPM